MTRRAPSVASDSAVALPTPLVAPTTTIVEPVIGPRLHRGPPGWRRRTVAGPLERFA